MSTLIADEGDSGGDAPVFYMVAFGSNLGKHTVTLTYTRSSFFVANVVILIKQRTFPSKSIPIHLPSYR
jgi:hypothetical protein